MTTHVDLYYTMRSPYCYLSTPQLRELVAEYDLEFDVKPVYPLAVSDPAFFDRVNPLWPPYVAKDTSRIAKRLSIPFRWPRPDPIARDAETKVVLPEQPLIRRLTQLAQAASEHGCGLDFLVAVSATLFSRDVDGWNTGTDLEDSISNAGMNFRELEKTVVDEGERLEAAIAANRRDQLAAGHWGAPLFVYDSEIFFGQDRIEDLVWHLKNCGLSSRRGP